MANGKSKRTVSQDELFDPLVAAHCFDAFGDSTRRAIMQLLHQRPHTVGELADRLPVTRPAVSQHIKQLREAGLVQVSKEGTRHIVSLDPAGLEALRNYLDQLWRAALPGFVRSADAKSSRR